MIDLPQVLLDWVLIGFIQFIMRSVLNFYPVYYEISFEICSNLALNSSEVGAKIENLGTRLQKIGAQALYKG
jgi:hypothetical protein